MMDAELRDWWTSWFGGRASADRSLFDDEDDEEDDRRSALVVKTAAEVDESKQTEKI